MKKIRRFLWTIRDWLEPFQYERATYYTHRRVRLARWFVWALNVCVTAVFGFFIAVGFTGLSILSLIYEKPDVSVQWIIALFATEMCKSFQDFGPCTKPEGMWGIIAAVGGVALMVSYLLLAFNASPIKPDKVTDAELDELRMLGYMVMEEEDFANAIHEHRAMGDRDSGGPGHRTQPGQLDTAGPVDRGPQPEAESSGDLAEVDSRGA